MAIYFMDCVEHLIADIKNLRAHLDMCSSSYKEGDPWNAKPKQSYPISNRFLVFITVYFSSMLIIYNQLSNRELNKIPK